MDREKQPPGAEGILKFYDKRGYRNASEPAGNPPSS